MARTALFRPLRRSLFGALALVGAASCGSSEGDGVPCTAMACPQGLEIAFNVPTKAAVYEIVVSVDTSTPERVEIMTCTLTVQASGNRELLCNSAYEHQMLGSGVTFREMFANVHVVITEGTATVVEESVAPNYVTEEVNGPGCGSCTHATLDVTVSQGAS